MIFSGLIISELLIETGIIKKFEKKFEGIAKLANLPPICGITLVTALGSTVSADTILQNFRENKKLNETEVLLASILNSTVMPIRQTFTYHLPVILPMLGLYVGLVYISTLWLGFLVLFFFVVVAGRIILKRGDTTSAMVEKNILAGEKSLKKVVKKSVKRFIRIAIIFVVTTFAVFTLMDFGLLEGIKEFVAPFARLLNLPPSIFLPLAAYIASPIVGFSMISSLLQSGAICEREAIIALLFGSIFMLPIVYLRYNFPLWISIFGFKLGVLRGLINLSFLMLTRVLVLALFCLIA